MMELYIETLTGTAFELRVSPFETIMSVKAKIQRLEGIPISQQHLIWQSMELEDDYCLHDYSIHDGATLKLVLAMRGGPINTRRISMEDPALREMAEYMEANRDEILEKLPGNRQVTLLVYREGDQLNFFRVVDRGDGTLTPLSESLSPLHFSGASMYNLYDDDDDDDGSPKEVTEENIKTKEKMQLLRSKMETLTLTKKPKKKPVPRPPSTGRPGSHTRSSAHRLSSSSGPVTRHALGALAKNPLPPVGHSRSSSGSHNPEPPSGRTSVSSVLSATNDTPSDLGLPASARRRLEVLDSAKLRRPLSSVKEDASSAAAAAAAAQRHRNVLDVKKGNSNSEGAAAAGATAEGEGAAAAAPAASPAADDDDAAASGASHQTVTAGPEDSKEKLPKEATALRTITPLLSGAHSRKKESSAGTQEKLLKEMAQTWPSTSSAQQYTSRKKDSLNHSLSMCPPTSSNKGLERIIDHSYEAALGHPTTTSASARRTKDVTFENMNDSLVRPPTSKYANVDRKQGLMLESLSQIEARGLLRQASLERLGSSRISNFVRSASKSRASFHLGSAGMKDGSRVATPEGRLVSARLQRMSASRDGRMMSPAPRLPPVKQKKKPSKRCFVCAKKTGLATSYQCRCGNNFCATHRYAESHDCTFDYKSEGRKLLEQSNPVVSAPKLPKI